MQRACAVLSSVACTATQYFCTLSKKWHDFRGGDVAKHKMCVVIFSTNMSETFFVLSRCERDMVKNIHRSSCKVPVIHVTFS